MKQRVYDEYLPLARISAPSFRFDRGRKDDPIYVVTAVDERHYPRQWDAGAALFHDVAGDNLAGEKPDGLDRRKDWLFGAYLKDRPGQEPLLVGLDAMPSRAYRKSVLPSASKDFTTLVVAWKPSGLVEVVQRPPLVSGEAQARILRTLNDLYLGGKKKLEAGTAISTGKKHLGTVIRVSDSEIEIRPATKASAGKPVYAVSDEE